MTVLYDQMTVLYDQMTVVYGQTTVLLTALEHSGVVGQTAWMRCVASRRAEGGSHEAEACTKKGSTSSFTHYTPIIKSVSGTKRVVSTSKRGGSGC